MYECLSARRRYMNNVGVDVLAQKGTDDGGCLGARRHGCVVAWMEICARMHGSVES